jgi:heat shock protein HslJ
MKNPKSLVIAFFTLLTITSCEPTLIKNTETKSGSISTTTATNITDVTWKITLINSDAITGSATDYYLKLNASNGTFESKAGCNQIFGSFLIKDNFISFSKIGSTKMYCFETMKFEDAYLSILANTSKYVVIDSTKFILLQDDMVIAQFEIVQ